jgi:hypothetical protein
LPSGTGAPARPKGARLAPFSRDTGASVAIRIMQSRKQPVVHHKVNREKNQSKCRICLHMGHRWNLAVALTL